MNKFNIKNNNKEIGKVNILIKNVKKILVGTTCGVVLLTTVGCSKKNDKKEVVEEIYHSAYEPTYKVQYEVQAGDNLTGIIYSYESDANKVYSYIAQIIELNDLPQNGYLQNDSVITLVGVPEEKLGDFNYSSDYTLFPMEFELNDRIEFIDHYKDNINMQMNEEEKVLAFF